MGHRLEEVHQAKAQFVLTNFPGLTMFTITTDHCKMLIKTKVSSQEKCKLYIQRPELWFTGNLSMGLELWA